MGSAGIIDSLGAVVDIVAPTIAKGVIIRRPKAVGMAERLGLDDRAVRRMQKLRARYGDGPLRLRAPGKPRFLLISPDDVKRVLAGTPEPFAATGDEKEAALAHFEPKVALISHGGERADRRRFNEETLETPRKVHSLSEAFAGVIDEEVDALIRQAADDGRLDWSRFFMTWYRIVRRVVLGDGARDDHALTDMLETLRGRANWAFFRSQDKELRDKFHERLQSHLDRAEQGSMAQIIAATPKTAMTAPSHQVAQWLFAFDPGGMATFRALALLASHPEAEDRARQEAMEAAGSVRPLPYLRATLLESLRLWATTPAILRQTTREVEWRGGGLPSGAMIVIFAPFFHRDEERLDFANRFAPEVWLEGDAGDWPLVPFSGGSGLCPARNFVPLIASLVLARILARLNFQLATSHGLDNSDNLPGTLNNYRLEFTVSPRATQHLAPAEAAAP